MVSIIEKLKAVRADRHFSLQDVAMRLGVSIQTVHRWEKFQCQPRGENYRMLKEFVEYWEKEGD